MIQLMVVSAKEREHMQRLGAYQREGAADRQSEHERLPLGERIERSLTFSISFLDSANLAARLDDPTPLYERARRLGLYRP